MTEVTAPTQVDVYALIGRRLAEIQESAADLAEHYGWQVDSEHDRRMVEGVLQEVGDRLSVLDGWLAAQAARMLRGDGA